MSAIRKYKRTCLAAMLLLVMAGCGKQKQADATSVEGPIFDKGEQLHSDIITGQAWHKILVESDSVFTTAVGSETFTPGSRNVWHSHPCGQIIMVTSGVGYHQIDGHPVQVLRKGDVAKCPPGVKHWHGASKDSAVTQIYILPNTEKGMVKWFGKVSDKAYNNVN